MIGPTQIADFFNRLQGYVGWTAEDAKRVHEAWSRITPFIDEMIDDFYQTIERHEFTLRVITGGEAQITRLKATFRQWITTLFQGPYDSEYAWNRWEVGRRHVSIGLEQAYAIAALARLRGTINRCLTQGVEKHCDQISNTIVSINKLLDLDLSLIDYAYQLNAAELLKNTAAEKIKQSERLAAIGQMVTGLAHESRNALQRSHACLETLILDIQDRPDALKQANRIQSALDRLHLLYEEVRNYASPIKLEKEAVDAEKLISVVWQNLEPRWSENQTQVEFCCESSGPCLLFVDRHRIDQVITNLLQNAIDASGPGGRLRCSLIRDSNGTCRLYVEDSGPGIPDELQDRIFDPFFTTKSKGTGLGLAITRRIVEAHLGSLTVSKSELGGARFILEIPQEESTFRTVQQPST